MKNLPIKRILKIGAALCLIGLLSIFTLIFAVRYGVFGDLPTNEELRSIDNPIASEIYSSDGVLLGKYYIENRSNVQFNDISEYLVKALVATEDARFFEHKGVDSRSVFRVLIKSVLMGNRSAGGGSTISQQLSKNLYPRQSYFPLTMPVNKIKEIITAQRLERIYPKEEILTLYLNTVSFGEKAFGIGTAARRFFNKIPNEVSIDEAAMLIGLLKGPGLYNPRLHPERAIKRRNTVLSRMSAKGYVREDRIEEYKKQPLNLKYTNISQSEGFAPYFRHVLRDDLKKWCEDNIRSDGYKYNLFKDGLKIYTTIDSKMQVFAQEAVTEHMTEVQGAFRASGFKPYEKNPKILEDAKKQCYRYLSMKKQGKSTREIEKAFNTPQKMSVFVGDRDQEVTMTPLDSLKHYLEFFNASFMAVDPETAHVKAWVGGINHTMFKRDFVTHRRQVGSTFKPLVYAAAFEEGVEPCAYFSNEKKVYKDHQNWSPRNYDGKYGGAYSLEEGLTKSMNTVAAELVLEVGVEPVIEVAKELGVENKLPAVPSIALGSGELTLFEMVGAYAALANGGYQTKPQYLLKIEDRKGRVLDQFKTKKKTTRKKVLAKRTAEVVTAMIQNVVNEGTARSLRSRYSLTQDIAGKTGTTQNYTDGWFIGYTPDLVAGAWVGHEDRRIRFESSTLGSSTKTALPIWAKFFQKIFKDAEYRAWTQHRFVYESYKLDQDLNCEAYLEELPDEYWLAYGRDDEGEMQGELIEGEDLYENNDDLAINEEYNQGDQESFVDKIFGALGFGKKKREPTETAQSNRYRNDDDRKGNRKKKNRKKDKKRKKEREREKEKAKQNRENGSQNNRNSQQSNNSGRINTDCEPDLISEKMCYCRRASRGENGFTIHEYNNGEKESEGNYGGGKQQGFWKFYYQNGKSRMEGNYGGGMRNGFWKDYYESGIVQQEGNFSNCRREGWWKYYDRNGQLQAEGNYQNGIKNGTWKFYFEGGQKEEARFNCR